MSDTTFVDFSGPAVPATWLNDINIAVYRALGSAGVAPTTAAQVISNLAIPTLTQLAANNGSTLVGFLQSGVGSVGRTVNSKMTDVVCALDFGAKGDNSTDNTAAMTAAHATGRLIYYPAGTYKFTSGIIMPSGGILGDGPTQTILSSTDTTSANLMIYTGTDAPLFTEFQLLNPLGKLTGAGIQINPASGESQYGYYQNIWLNQCPIGIDQVRASLWQMLGCKFLAYRVAGVQVDNLNNTDSGDSFIGAGSVFNCPYTTGAGILQKGSGGLKVLGNKFLGGAFGYLMQFTSGGGAVSSSDLLVAINSFEQQATSACRLTRTSGTGVFSNIALTGNQIALVPIGIDTDSSGFLNTGVGGGLTISGGSISLNGTGTPIGISLNAVDDFTIGAVSLKGNGGTSTGVSHTNCSNGKIGVNTYRNLTNTVSAFTPTNVFNVQESQSGAATTLTTGWAAYGGLFQSTTTSVTFAVPFTSILSASDIHLEAGAGNGEVSGILVAVTTSGGATTGFTFKAVSVNTGIAATINWKAWGTI